VLRLETASWPWHDCDAVEGVGIASWNIPSVWLWNSVRCRNSLLEYAITVTVSTCAILLLPHGVHLWCDCDIVICWHYLPPGVCLRYDCNTTWHVGTALWNMPSIWVRHWHCVWCCDCLPEHAVHVTVTRVSQRVRSALPCCGDSSVTSPLPTSLPSTPLPSTPLGMSEPA